MIVKSVSEYVLLPCLLLMMSAAGAAQADAVVEPLQVAQVAPAQQLVKMTVGLLIVLLTIFAVAYLVQRYSRLSAVGRGDMNVVSSLAVGSKERIVLLQVGKQQVLLGVTPQHISTLHVLPENIDVEVRPPAQGGQAFAQRLKAALNG